MHKAFGLLSKSYDLRGIYPTQIDAEFYYQLGRCLAIWAPDGKISIGGDARLSTNELKNACICGFMDGGREVVDIGLVSSDMLQFSSIQYSEEVGLAVMITASHNPKEYNGLKMCLKNAGPINLRKIAPELTDIAQKIETIDVDTAKQKVGNWGNCHFETRNIVHDWVKRLKKFTQNEMDGLTIVADAGNGTAGAFMGHLAKEFGFELIPLYFEPDGNFPNHHPSPIELKNVVDLQNTVKKTGADLGVAFDGDADRAVLCDETGEIISSSILLAAISELFLLENPGKTIIANVVTGKIVEDTVKSLGGNIVYEKVGHVYIKEQMSKNPDIILGGEHSSHYFFPSLGNMDSGAAAFVLFLEYMKQFDLSASQVRLKFSKYIGLEETNFRVNNPEKILEIVSEKYHAEAQSRFDGLTITGKDYWFNFRMSSNEPLLRLNLEAKNKEVFESVQKDLIELLNLHQ